jgi:hypothetical protein
MYKYKENWLKGLAARNTYYKRADRRVFQISAYHVNEADKIVFRIFEARPLSKGGALFIHSSIPYGNSQAKYNRKLVFLWFLEVLEEDKCFELLEVAKPLEVMLAHRNRGSPFIYPTGLANKGFTLLLAFNSAPILIGLGILSDALLGRRSHNESLVGFDILTLF